MENFQQKFQENITRSLEIGIKEPVYRWGPVKITWRPELGTGQIDIIETKGMNFYDLKEFWEQVRTELPEAKWELNPDKAIKDRIYAMMFKGDPQITRSGDEGMRAKGREGFILDNSKFNVNNLEGSELFRYAEKWLTDNPGKTLRDFKKETRYDGPPLKPRQRKGEPIRLSYKGKSTDAQVKRVKETQFKTEEEARYVRGMQKQARELSQDPIHQIVYGGRPSVAEHNLRGDHEMMSISNPDFAAYKTEVETRALKKGYLTGLDNVSGEIVIAPQESFNKYDPASSPGARVISEGTDIATLIGKLPTKATQVGNIVSNNPVTRALGLTNEGRLAQLIETSADIAKGISPGTRFGMSLLPGLGIVGDTADAAVKLEEAQAPDASWLDKAQATVASTVAATSVIPEPTAQTYNFIAGLGLGASDVIEHYGESIWRHLGTVKHPLKGFYK